MRAWDGANKEELKSLADALDVATDGFFGDPRTVDVKKFCGAWARARRRWSEVSGEALV